MAIYELRTYTVAVGQMGALIDLYKSQGFPALAQGGFDNKLVAYFTGDIGAMNEVVHLWKFDDDADRRDHWRRVFADQAFMAFAVQLRPMLLKQQNKLLLSAPWGPGI